MHVHIHSASKNPKKRKRISWQVVISISLTPILVAISFFLFRLNRPSVQIKPAPPTVYILAPANGLTTKEKSVRIEAQAKDDKQINKISVKINGREYPELTSNLGLPDMGQGRIFDFTAPLILGNNIIEITATNDNGLISSASIAISREEEEKTIEPPIRTKTSPFQPPSRPAPKISKDAVGIIDAVDWLIDQKHFTVSIACEPEKSWYAIGETVRFRVHSENPGYLTLLDINSKNEVVLLYPNFYEQGGIIGTNPKSVPNEEYGESYIIVSEPTGTDFVLAIVTSSFIDFTGIRDWDQRRVYRGLTRGNFQQFSNRFRGLTIKKLESLGQITWGAGKVSIIVR